MIQDLTRGDFFTYFERVFRLSLSEARKIEIVWWIGLNRRKLGERTFFLKLIRPVKADLITYLCHSRLLLYYFIPPFPFLAQLSLFFFLGVLQIIFLFCYKWLSPCDSETKFYWYWFNIFGYLCQIFYLYDNMDFFMKVLPAQFKFCRI